MIYVTMLCYNVYTFPKRRQIFDVDFTQLLFYNQNNWSYQICQDFSTIDYLSNFFTQSVYIFSRARHLFLLFFLAPFSVFNSLFLVSFEHVHEGVLLFSICVKYDVSLALLLRKDAHFRGSAFSENYNFDS